VPVYETLPGWKESISHCRTLAELPTRAREYVARIETLAGCKIGLVSIGRRPRRDDPARAGVLKGNLTPRRHQTTHYPSPGRERGVWRIVRSVGWGLRRSRDSVDERDHLDLDARVARRRATCTVERAACSLTKYLP